MNLTLSLYPLYKVSVREGMKAIPTATTSEPSVVVNRWWMMTRTRRIHLEEKKFSEVKIVSPTTTNSNK